MPIAMKLEFGGIFERAKLADYARRTGKNVNKAVAAGMKSGGRGALAQVRKDYARSVKVSKGSFANVIGIRLYDKKPDEFPALRIGSNVAFFAAHVFGANIPGPVLIPLLDNGARIGRKKFSLLIRGLIRSGNAEFRRVNGRTIVFAESAAATQVGLNLSRFRKAERARRGGVFRKQRGKALEVPIAVLVRNVRVRPRFAFKSSVQANLPLITRAIQIELDKK